MTQLYTLSLHDALPILASFSTLDSRGTVATCGIPGSKGLPLTEGEGPPTMGPEATGGPSLRPRKSTSERRSARSEEHTSELQSHSDLVCRLLLEKKKQK